MTNWGGMNPNVGSFQLDLSILPYLGDIKIPC